MSAIDEMMAQFQLSDEERRKIMIQNALLGLGAGLMSSGKGKGSWLNSAGQGMLMGAQMGQNAVQDARAAKVSDFKMREYVQGQQAKAEAERARQAEAQQLAGIFSGQPDLSQMGPGGPTPDNAQRVVPERAKQYLKAADFYAARGEAEKAAKYQAMAEEEFATTPQTVMRDGRAVNVLVGKRGGVKEMTGYDPTPKLREVNTGGAVNIVNDYNLPASGQTFAKTMTPGEEASNKVAWANYGLSKNADQRAAAAAAGGGKPQLVDGQWVYPPDEKNPAGRAVPVGGFTAKQEKPTDQQLATGGFLDRMQFASKYLDALEDKGYAPGLGQAATTAAKSLPLIGGATGYAAESIQNIDSSSAAYRNAQDAWIRAKLRKESGAVIGAEEMEAERKTFFPQPNDPKEVREQKRALRKQVEQSMVYQSRGGYQGAGNAPDPLGIR